MATTTMQIQSQGDCIIEIPGFGTLSVVDPLKGQDADQTELTIQVEPSMSELRKRGHGMANTDGSKDENWTQVDQVTSSANEQSEAESERTETTAGKTTKIFSWPKLLQTILPKRLLGKSPEELKSFNERQGYTSFIHKNVDTYPEGYPQLAALLNSDDTFLIYRKFGRMINRVLLHRQSELTVLEAQLDKLDLDDAADSVLESRLRGYEEYSGWNGKQRELIDKFEKKWSDYIDLILKVASTEALGKAPERNHISVFNWVWERSPLSEEKRKSFLHNDDFISLARHSHKDRWAQNVIEGYIDKYPDSILKRFLQTQKEKDKTNDAAVDYYSSERLSLFGNLLAVLLGTIVLLTPVFILSLIKMSRVWMCLTGGAFVVLSTTILASITGARPHELLFGMAANAAVVFIVLGNMNG